MRVTRNRNPRNLPRITYHRKKKKEKRERKILQKEGKEKEQKENQYKQQIMGWGKFIYLILFFKNWANYNLFICGLIVGSS